MANHAIATDARTKSTSTNTTMSIATSLVKKIVRVSNISQIVVAI